MTTKLTSLESISINETLLSKDHFELAFSFAEGGELMRYYRGMNAEQIAFELRNLAARIERRIK